MMFKRPSKVKRSTRPRRRAMPRLALARPVRANPQPIFTETYSKGVIAPNTGGILTFNINEIPQLSQYNTLY